MGRKLRRSFRFTLPAADAAAVARLPRDYLSFTVDTSLLLGGHWWGSARSMKNGVSVDVVAPLDLGNRELVRYARALSPAMLRIGGTEADHVRYKSGGKAATALGVGSSDGPDSTEHRFSLGKGLWKRIHRFIAKARLELLFTVSAGPSDRDRDGAWTEDNLKRLVAYSVRKGYPVAAWELGNEVNGFPFIYGLDERVSVRQYSLDFARFGAFVRSLSPKSLLVGPASAVWPRLGEMNPLMRGFCSSPAAGFLDALSWHYYPQQSGRGRVAVRRASETTMLDPRNLDEVRRLNRRVRECLGKANRCRPAHLKTRNWVTETAHALYGGESGLSDTFVSTLWWLDELGLLAREGVEKVFRQSLVGADYGLLDQRTMKPAPDYYASFLWKRLMGREVLDPAGLVSADRRLRVYLHRGKALTLLAINIHPKRGAKLEASGAIGTSERYLLNGADGFASRTLAVNGVAVEDDLVFSFRKPETRAKYRTETFSEAERSGRFDIPPLSAFFLRFRPRII